MQDITGYNERMASSILDKLFFMRLIDRNDIDTIVDFGCANAELFRHLPYSWTKDGDAVIEHFDKPVDPGWNMVGIDNNEEMIRLAKENFPAGLYVSTFSDLPDISENTLLNISSTIHEIYSYCTLEEIDEFWNNVFGLGFRYISIRDMMTAVKSDRPMSEEEARILKEYNRNDPRKMHNDFRRCWPEMRVRDMLHFMQKNRYVDNWDRECQENYFPITVEYLLSLVPENYEIVYLNAYCLEYVKNRILEDFGYEVKDPTHIQLLLRRK